MGNMKQWVGHRLKMCRLMRGLTQQEVAKFVEKTTNAVSNWENGNTSPSMDDLMRLFDWYEMTPNQFFGYDAFPELAEFIKTTNELNKELDSLEKQREEIDKKIKMYTEMLNRK